MTASVTGDLCIALPASDGTLLAYKVVAAKRGGNAVIPVRFSDGLLGAAWVVGMNKTDDYGFSANAGSLPVAVKTPYPKAWAWGLNGAGQLGDETNTTRDIPVMVYGEHIFTSVACGLYHSLAIDEAGNAWAWGNNGYGQLGDETNTKRDIPVMVHGGHIFTAIASGQNHSLAIDEDGNAWAWGLNYHGQLGDETNTNRDIPVMVHGGHIFTAIAGGIRHSLAIDEDGNAWAWGSNGYGQLGDETYTDRDIPVMVHGGHSFAFISSSHAYHSVSIVV